MTDRNESGKRDEKNEADLGAAPREQEEGPEKRHGDALLEGNGSRHGADAGEARRD